MTPDELHALSLTYGNEWRSEDYSLAFVEGFMMAVELMQVRFENIPPPKDQSDSRS